MPQDQPTILLVEDDELIRDFTLTVLAEAGYTTAVVYHHDAVRGALRRTPADLILADSAGAGPGDVWPALDTVRSAAGTVPVLIFSAHNPDRFAGYARRGFAGWSPSRSLSSRCWTRCAPRCCWGERRCSPIDSLPKDERGQPKGWLLLLLDGEYPRPGGRDSEGGATVGERDGMAGIEVVGEAGSW